METGFGPFFYVLFRMDFTDMADLNIFNRNILPRSTQTYRLFHH